MTKKSAFEGAERKGREARYRGKARTESPYLNSNAVWISESPVNGATTWIQTFHRRWLDGWEEADREIKNKGKTI